MSNVLTLSVHQLVDFLLRSGDIDNRVFNANTMNEGTLLHALYQSKQGENYLSEYHLKQVFNDGEVAIELEGRADGIIKKSEVEYIVDEIKTTTIDLQTFRDSNIEWHLGQAKCYGLMFMKEKNLSTIGIRLTYIRQGNVKERLIEETYYSYDELNQYVHSLIEEYLLFYNAILRLRIKRDQSIKEMEFPFPSFRKGQKELGKYAYSLSKKGGRLFVEAPTGIGKTMSTLYPFIKSLPDDDERKIFYATAKSSGKENAHKALMILKERGLELGHIVLTSKEKICFCKDKACNPDECLYAKGYYNKIKGVLKHCLLHESTFTYPNIVDTAYKYEICPFEFELDLSNFLDVIICDYNYIYDPISYLKRFFDADASHHLALVDEAHNLVSRSQDMYSAELLENEYLLCKKSLTHVSNRKLKTSLSIFKDLFAFYKEEEIKNPLIIDFIDEKYHKGIDKFLDVVADTLKDYPKDVTKELMNFYLNVHRFRKIGELFNQDNFIIYIYQKDDGTLSIKYFCLNPSKYLRSISNSMKAVIYFSATLSPTTYYVDTLGGDKEKDPILKLSSPFPRNNLKLLIAPKLSIKYRNRDKSYQQVAEYIKEFVSHKVGNYLVYLPSYEYLNQLKPLISDESIDFIYQTRDMNEQDRLAFLSNFIEDPQKTVVGFAIIGGSFGEGIDLVSDRLIGVVIVGIGLPKINFESDCVAEYFNNENINGHHYAYLYPGFNKVQQAVGRVIRSETDKGSALLIDERYMSSELQDLYRYEWKNYQVVFSTDDIKNHLQDIFKTK